MALFVIPARFGSTRLPGKPLLSETGRPLVVHVLENAARARSADRVVVATDDERILAAVRDAGGEAVLTSPDHRSGTDRVAEAARGLPGGVVVNVQGDEPELDPEHLDRLVAALDADPEAGIATLAAPAGPGDDASPHVVKVVVAGSGRALYFSRSPIPYHRDEAVPRLRHAGVYAFRREALEAFVRTPPTPLERAESLEQLRALESGVAVKVVVVDRVAPGIDTPEDYAAFVARRREKE
jgi:3-deoxy-manno-octulosonate cytidylyltransferase (CMP-KDO synthetase)